MDDDTVACAAVSCGPELGAELLPAGVAGHRGHDPVVRDPVRLADDAQLDDSAGRQAVRASGVHRHGRSDVAGGQFKRSRFPTGFQVRRIVHSQTKILRSALFLLAGGALTAQTTWTSFADRRGHAMAGTSGGVVMFGGESVTNPGQVLGGTFGLSTNNQMWTEGGTDGPAPATGAAMGAATVSGQPTYVLFGGQGPSGVLSAKTWKYNGSGWGDVTPLGLSPSGRRGHAMVANPVTQTMFLFGGYDGVQDKDDVWEFAPQTDTWVQRNLGGSGPSARQGCCMAFHPHGGGTNGRVYLFGGSAFDDETWEYNPYTSVWTQLFPAVSPPGRYLASMAYVSVGARIVLFGGLGLPGSSAVPLGDTWVFTRSGPAGTPTWTQVTGGSSPDARYAHGLTVSSSGAEVVLLGGTNAIPVGSASTVLEETWKYSVLGGWTKAAPSPTPRDGVAMAYDSVRNRHVVFGGRTPGPNSVDLAETWEIDGLNWIARSPSLPPQARSDAAMAYHEQAQTIVLFGGKTNVGTNLGDTWEYNGSSWTPVSFSVGQLTPPANSSLQAVYDAVRAKVWLPVPGAQSIEMYSYDGSAWALTPTPITAPSSRIGYAAAYDVARDVTVLFGGQVGTAYVNDTWEWNGTTWSLRTSPSLPSARQRGRMVYDSFRKRCVLFGGLSLNGTPPVGVLDDTWEWDGVAWRQANPIVDPGGAWSHDMSYDRSMRRSVVYTGASVWDYESVQPATVTPFGQGCPTTSSVPSTAPFALKPLPWTGAWLGESVEMEFEHAPVGLGLFLWGFSDTAWTTIPLPLPLYLAGLNSAPSCYLRVSPDIVDTIPLFATRYVSPTMPSSPTLLGATLYGQAAYVDMGDPSWPLVTSNAAEFVLGAK
ncbi:MAG: hypothetical protein JNK15_00245 [Planctomycetes bacterium]|nr:hypothetical protein [Planctomycetota bacterium]